MKTKSKIILSSILAAIFFVACVCLGIQLFNNKNNLIKGIYDGSFTALAENETTTSEIGAIKGMVSTDDNYLLLATALKITDFSDYTAVGYEITENGKAVEGNLESNKYYTAVTVQTTNGSKTWTMDEIFVGDTGVSGMIVVEISYKATADYVFKPYVVKDGNKIYGEEQSIAPKTYTFTSDEAFATPYGSSDATWNEDGYWGSTSGKTFTTTVYVSRAVDVTFIFTGARSIGTYATETITDANGETTVAQNLFSSLTLNGDTAGVTPTGNTVTYNGWNNWLDYEAATLSLQAGTNTVSFTMARNINIPSVSFKSVVPVSLVQVFLVADNNPFDSTLVAGASAVAGETYSLAKVTDATNGTYYQNTQGAAFTTTVNVSEAVDVTFIIKVTGSTKRTESYADSFPSITLNGTTDGVVRKDDNLACTGWSVAANACDAMVATLSLKSGNNVISFTRGTNNINLAGIGFISSVPVSLVQNQNFTKSVFLVADNDPFDSTTVAGASAVVGTNTNFKKTTHATNGTYYENTQGATFTTTVYVSKATDVTFTIIVTGNGRTESYEDSFPSITLVGIPDGVSRNDGNLNCTGWNANTQAYDAVVATLSLKEGNNVISFTIGTLKINVAGIAFISSVPVTLAPVQN